MPEPLTHNDLILAHLKFTKGITPLEALNMYGCLRLSSVIHRLRRRGYQIAREMVEFTDKTGHQKKYARYYMGGKYE